MSDEEEQPLNGTLNLTNPCLPTPSITNKDDANTIKILVATDNHIGYAESDPIRGQDSINTFREILQLAVDHEVDMLLLAGDLFHENRPSRASLYSTIASLREYCLNDRPVRIELIGDSGIGIPHSFNFPPVNYEDRNLNVGLPVFSIHGNHDDPQGMGPEGALCALDVLSASGLINYFGRQELPGGAQRDEEALEEGLHIQPVLLQKGRTRLAMYGIGNIRDERFNYEMRSNRIRMSRPAEFKEQWFNLMLVHQNRVAHGPKNFVPEDGFGDDIDLVIWGHEHDCLITPQEIPGKGYFITQPGSSVATSLAKGESIKKHVGILEVQDKDFSLLPIPLKSVRPFIFDDIVLAEHEEEAKLKLDEKPKVVRYLKSLVEQLIKKATTDWNDEHDYDPDSPPMMLPLIRLRVEYSRADGLSAYDVGNPQRFGQDFLGKVANPKDLVQFYRRRKIGPRKPKNDIDLPEEEEIEDSQAKAPEKVQVATLVHQYLEAQNLGVLAENGMQRAVTLFVEKDDKDAIKEFYHNALEATQAHVKGSKADIGGSRQDRNPESEDEELLGELTKAKESYADTWEKNQKDELTTQKGKGKAVRKAKRNDDDSDESDFGKMSDVRYVDESDNGDPAGQSDSDISIRASVAPKKKAPAKAAPVKKAPAKKAAPAAKAPPKRAATKTAATSSRSRAAASQSQTTLDFSQQAPLRGASRRTAASQSNPQMVSDDSDDSIEVSTQRKTASRSRR
ncbi:meiotic recombination [Puccinia graminis f. sp. tritici]|uniref:Double-strand break repair protein n=2 Tax=Puccinia graminis f. sp. tritici TaxID=56615 RepID=E3KAD0_PUCGT|nr:double-strand break repair protein MRE11 [Puccinia graminis f. sp. tritici CRL 75-36-700-3]EFP81287.1 double-strand break repair protein MRE11 [Puccinia graminis f. sp. tritici CRL 75-36-700-3]KAA1119206.1 meiotic recombination [Puccinia graminis f. sp. tritici]